MNLDLNATKSLNIKNCRNDYLSKCSSNDYKTLKFNPEFNDLLFKK